jgi:hypothetical protein
LITFSTFRAFMKILQPPFAESAVRTKYFSNKNWRQIFVAFFCNRGKISQD